jgi:anti-sigma factor RsiW
VACDQLEPLIEAIADGSYQPGAANADHLATCPVCAARLAEARAIESLLTMRDVAAPPPAFTAAVMARVGQERWKTERVIDLGFNVAMAAGILFILAGGTGLAWSLGLVNVTIDLQAIWEAFGSFNMTSRFLSQVQTIAMASALLTMALVLWWWAETAAD